jgi:hypothetical protein
MRIWSLVSETWRAWESSLPRCAEADCSGGNKLRIRSAGLDLQGRWYCSPQCVEKAVQRYFMRASVALLPTPHARHRIPLGLLMLSRGELENSQLRSALEAQRCNGRGMIGQWLEKLGFVTEQQITTALALQWACPVVPAPLTVGDLDSARLLPYRLMQQFRLLPIYFSRSNAVMYVAFSESVDYTALYAIEQMLECRTEACVTGSSAMTQALEILGRARRAGELLFEGWRTVEEMARTTCGCMLKMGARTIRTVTCGAYIWVRLKSDNDQLDLLFRRTETRANAADTPQDEKPLMTSRSSRVSRSLSSGM